MPAPIRVAIATPLEAALKSTITSGDPRVELLVEDDLLPPRRYPGDHRGDPHFRRSPDQESTFRRLLESADVLYGIPDGDPATLTDVVRRNQRLRWVHTMAAGGGEQIKAANLTKEELSRITFTTSAGVHGRPLAEFALFGVLAGAKDLPRLRTLQQSRTWARRWHMRQISDQTIVVVGLGGVGAEVARLLQPLVAKVIGVSRAATAVPNVDEVHLTQELPRIVSQADAIVLALPGTHETGGLFSREIINSTRPGTVIVNVGRGSVIDEPALIDALRSGHLASAYLDVFQTEPLPTDSPLWTMPQVVISPHTAALSRAEDRRIAELFADNLARFVRGEKLRNLVDKVAFY